MSGFFTIQPNLKIKIPGRRKESDKLSDEEKKLLELPVHFVPNKPKITGKKELPVPKGLSRGFSQMNLKSESSSKPIYKNELGFGPVDINKDNSFRPIGSAHSSSKDTISPSSSRTTPKDKSEDSYFNADGTRRRSPLYTYIHQGTSGDSPGFLSVGVKTLKNQRDALKRTTEEKSSKDVAGKIRRLDTKDLKKEEEFVKDFYNNAFFDFKKKGGRKSRKHIRHKYKKRSRKVKKKRSRKLKKKRSKKIKLKKRRTKKRKKRTKRRRKTIRNN